LSSSAGIVPLSAAFLQIDDHHSHIPVTTAITSSRYNPIDARRLGLAGAVVALLDGSFVVVVYVLLQHRTTASRIFQGVASALLGASAFDGGMQTAAVGVALHTCVAFAWTIVWTVLYSRTPALRRFVSTNAGVIVAGVVYGIVVWLLMNDVVVPFTHAKVAPASSASFWIQLLWHPFGVGLPIVAISRTR
jgi:hypothetical protein